MPRRLLLREGDSKRAPSGFISISTKDGQLKTDDDKGASKPVSATGERFTSYGEVFKGDLVYLNVDGTVSVPGFIEDDDNKADNIIGVFLSDADSGESVSVITKGIISLDNFNFEPRQIYYIDSKGKLTTSVTPYIFGKSLTSNSIMMEISFIQSILNRYGVTPTFDKLSSSWNSSSKSIDLSWSTQDTILSFEIDSIGIFYQYETPLTSGSSIELSDDIDKYGLQNLSYYVGKITNEKGVSADFKFQILGIEGDDNSSISYSYLGSGEQYNKGVGLFKNTNIFANVKVEIILYSDGRWSFGDSNVLPIRKLFGFSGVEKDEDGQYVTVVFKDLDVKLYESENWVNSNNFITNDYSYSPSATINWFKNALAKTDWDGSMKLTTNGEIKVGSKIYYSRKSGEYVEIPVDRRLYLYDSKNVYLLGEKSIIESISDLKFVDFSSTTKAEKDTISKSFDKYSSTEFEFTGSFLFATIGDLTLNETIYYISLKDKLESLGIIGLTMNLFNGSQTVTVSSKGIIEKIVDVTTTTTTTQSPDIITFTKDDYATDVDVVSDYLTLKRGNNGGLFNQNEVSLYGDSFGGGITHFWASEPITQNNVFVTYDPVGLPQDVTSIDIELFLVDENGDNLLNNWGSWTSWNQDGSGNVSPSFELPIGINIKLVARDNYSNEYLQDVTFDNVIVDTSSASSVSKSFWYDDIWNTFDINSIDVNQLYIDIYNWKNSNEKIDNGLLPMTIWNYSMNGTPPLSVNKKMIMLDVQSGDFWKFEFLSWTQGNNGGGLSYTRQFMGSIVPPTTTTTTTKSLVNMVTSIGWSFNGTTATDNTYSDIIGSSDRSGSGSSFGILVENGIVTNVRILNGGSGYSVDESITITGSQIGGSDGSDDLVIVVGSIGEPDPYSK